MEQPPKMHISEFQEKIRNAKASAESASAVEIELAFEKLADASGGLLGETQLLEAGGSKREAVVAYLHKIDIISQKMGMTVYIAGTSRELGLPEDVAVDGYPSFRERAAQAGELFDFS